MSPISIQTSAAPASLDSHPQNSFGPKNLGEISDFLGLKLNDQHTVQEINDLLIRAFNTGSYEHSVHLTLSNFDFTLPGGETCVVPPEVTLSECRLISAGTMKVPNGSIDAARHGATVVAIGKGAVVGASTYGACAIALAKGSEATAKDQGIACAEGPGTTATAYVGGVAYAEHAQSEACARGVGSQAHARVAGALSTAMAADAVATASNGASAWAVQFGSVAIALNEDSRALSWNPGTVAISESRGARATGFNEGRAIARGDGAIEVNPNGEVVVLKSAPVARFEVRKTAAQISGVEELQGRRAESGRQKSGAIFQGKYGNESITADDLDLLN